MEVKCLHDLRFPTKYKDWYVIYPSSEAAGLFYKEFIEDILLRLKVDGAVLRPRFECFRAHHNKVFMELYKTAFHDESLKTIKTQEFYGYEDLQRFIDQVGSEISYPVVLKTSSGAGSVGVAFAKDEGELIKKVNKMGKVTFFNNQFSYKARIRFGLGNCKRWLLKEKIFQEPSCREKMILQNFIPNL